MRLELADEPFDEDDFTELLLDLATELEENLTELLLNFTTVLEDNFTELLFDSAELLDFGISLGEYDWVAELTGAEGHSCTGFH